MNPALENFLYFRHRLVDIRDFAGELLLKASAWGDNAIAILARLPI